MFMSFPAFKRLFGRIAAVALCAAVLCGAASAQQQQTPLTNPEFLALVRQLPQRPDMKEQLVSEIRRRGIGFTLTAGLRSFIATKSGNDEELRRVLEEAERRFLNPKVATPLPPEAEATALLSKAREATNEALEQMPDFVVKQLVTRSYARGTTHNWRVSDHLIVGVSYRPSEGERYRLLSVNGIAGTSAAATEKSDYRDAGGSNSTGEFVLHLRALFEEESHTEFKPLDMDTLRGRRTVIYTFDIKKANSRWVLTSGDSSVIAAKRGKVWIDRENARVLRLEFESYDVSAPFPFRSVEVTLDYDWVKIPGQGDYLLPSHSMNVITVDERGDVQQFRNDIRFRNYQKYGTELKILDDDIIDEDVPKETPPPPPKPPEKKP
ncbi:MAG: hypothetical protein QOJ70_2406 [Acidobacteriota bacterium]|jgi:hypothetical protein|nr:hypothetical protein [Acidobacteriota bacterium]MDT7808593.1 hypothetical protein [Acidobacteriota bacterium]